MKPTGFFQEDNGNLSSIRLMSFISLLASILFGFLTILMAANHPTADVSVGIYITFGFLLGAFAPKVIQKFGEEKVTKLLTEKGLLHG